MPPGFGASRRAFGPSLDVTFPNDPYLIPFLTMEQPGASYDPKTPTRVTNDLLKNARLIADRRTSAAWPCSGSPTARSPATN